MAMNPNKVFLRYFSMVQPLIKRQQNPKIPIRERVALTQEIKRCDRMMRICTKMDDFDVPYVTSITSAMRQR